jgi:antitoxin (DNA-binding transcriptional repressor) of toxin-antitoxin stability system
MGAGRELEGVMAKIDTDDLISVTEAGNLGLSRLLREAEEGHDRIVMRNNKPVAAVVNMRRLEEMQDLQDDLTDVTLVAARVLMGGERRFSLDEVLTRFGFTREQLRKVG